MNRKYLDIPRFLIIASMALVVSCGGGGGGDDRFPTPELPKDAMKFKDGNAADSAETIMGFSATFSQLPVFKTEAEPSLAQIVDSALDKVINWDRKSSGVAARTEDISGDLCTSGGTATVKSSESGSSSSGDIEFDKCNIGGGIKLNGNFAFDANWNDASGDYDFHTGGKLSIKVGSDSVTVEMNLKESGNLDSGKFSSTSSFSMSGVPGAAFLVETDKALKGNYKTMELTSGRLIAYGAANTRLRITVTGTNSAKVEVDDGSGSFVVATGSPIAF